MSDPLPHTLSRPRAVLAAWLMLAMVLLALIHGIGIGFPAWPAGIAAWGAGAALWTRLDRRQRRFALLLATLGAAAATLALWRGATPQWTGLLTQNTALLGMLGAVSFLQLVGLDDDRGELPRGARAKWQTLAGVHLFGAVINMSAVFIFAERIAVGGRLSPQQAALLARGFLAAALWSPFFAAMAVALTYAPGARLAEVAAAGAPLALVVLWIAGRTLPPAGDAAQLVGMPLRPAALWLPALLAACVIGGHRWLPGWSSLAIISASALAIGALVLTKRRGPAGALEGFAEHAARRLPAMSGELILFLSAGVFATGLQALMQTAPGWMPFTRFGPLQAAVLLAAMIVFAALGIHAVVTIVIVSAAVLPLAPDPLLLAMVFLMAWGIGLAANPMSGVHLSLQGRFGLSSVALARANLRYCLCAYAAGASWLLLVGVVRGAA